MQRPSFDFLKQFPFWLLTAAVFITLIVPILIQDGMFMDGQQYAIVAKNLAEGRGTFWHPHLSDTWLRGGGHYFLEHPPLVYGIQSIFFRLFGDSMYIERFYSFLTALVTGWLIVLLWRGVSFGLPELRQMGWLPVLFWIIVPVCYWSYQNNMLENTMGIFTLAAVLLSYRALKFRKKKYLLLGISGIFIFLASLSKGVPGLFPLAFPAVYGVLHRKPLSRIIQETIILVLVPAVIYMLLLIYSPAYDSISFYIGNRLLSRISDEPTVGNHFFILGQLFLELLPVLVLVAILFLIIKIKRVKNDLINNCQTDIVLFLLMGAAASLPIMLTPVQKAFYVVPCFPLFGIGLAMFIAPGVERLVARWNTGGKSFLVFQVFAVGAFAGAITISAFQVGKASRHEQMLHDLYTIGPEIPKGTIIQVQPEMYFEWSLQFYFLRYYNISMDGSSQERNYYLVEKGKPHPGNYEKLPLQTGKYDLYKRTNIPPF